ncbi:c-type cytochrome [Solitalea canadensis]|uniref:Cytochrome c n=1 Tax=Solitalea canadensis (strain ATCC 29591 / DSM 3403 / JCM 21819 / LMG 8368 / NBRC 15130 / NCIMB 12057 / USAM 9D) TaxID=929556 RepID=H8KXX4_SOLCM|nr:cytochrome c [Solitalea canadensis]AFD05650.1 Cytochrome c [Solitalea canadensis DSM 3403]
MVLKVWLSLAGMFMIYTVIVYFKSDSQPNNIPPSEKAIKGWHLWQANNCHTCHQLYGLGGYMGPDLTNIASDSTKGYYYMKAFIKSGSAKMPDFHLSDTETDEIIAFLQWVDKSGKNHVSADQVHWTGTYIINN